MVIVLQDSSFASVMGRSRFGSQENIEVFKAAPGCAVLGLRLHNGRTLDFCGDQALSHNLHTVQAHITWCHTAIQHSFVLQTMFIRFFWCGLRRQPKLASQGYVWTLSVSLRLSWHCGRASPNSGWVGIEACLNPAECWQRVMKAARALNINVKWWRCEISFLLPRLRPRKMWAVYWLADGSGNDEVQSRNFVGQGPKEAWQYPPGVKQLVQQSQYAAMCVSSIYVFQAQGRESAFTFAQRVGGGQEMAWQCGPLRRLSWLQACNSCLVCCNICSVPCRLSLSDHPWLDCFRDLRDLFRPARLAALEALKGYEGIMCLAADKKFAKAPWFHAVSLWPPWP